MTWQGCWWISDRTRPQWSPPLKSGMTGQVSADRGGAPTGPGCPKPAPADAASNAEWMLCLAINSLAGLVSASASAANSVESALASSDRRRLNERCHPFTWTKTAE
jgi:hypothetical protein